MYIKCQAKIWSNYTPSSISTTLSKASWVKTGQAQDGKLRSVKDLVRSTISEVPFAHFGEQE